MEGSGCRLERNSDFLLFPGIDSLIMGCSDTPEDLGVCVGREEAEAFVEWIWNKVVPVVRALPDHRPCDESCSDDDDDEEDKVEQDEEEEVEEEENEETLCSRLVRYIREAHPDAVPFMGHSISQHAEGVLKGWQSGIVVLRGTPNGFTDVFPVSLDQSYESAVIALHERYKETLNKTSPPVEDDEEEWCDFSTHRNPKYWLRKFNKTALMKECDKSGLIIDNPMTTLNSKIIEALITADTI